MALAVNSLTSDNGDADGTSYVTASFGPTANALVLAAVLSRAQSVNPSTPTLSGGGMTTWDVIQNVNYSFSGVQRARITLFRSLQASPSSGTLTIDYAGATHSKCNWSIIEFTGVDTSGSNGSGAVVQSTQNSGTATSGLITLAALGSVNNGCYGAFAHNANEATAFGSGFTEIHDLAGANPASALQTEWKVNDTTVDASWTTSSLWGGIAIEVKESVAAAAALGVSSIFDARQLAMRTRPTTPAVR